MYGPLWRQRIAGQYHDWPVWRGEKTIAELAQRVIDEHGVRDGDCVVGTSLGGIVACEIANRCRLQRVVLIGSAASRTEINGMLAWLHPLIDLTPIAFVQACAVGVQSDVAEMFAKSDPNFIRFMTKAIFLWEGMRAATPPVRIHGTQDLLIPPPADVDYLIDGGHLLTMTHAEECIAVLTRDRILSAGS